MTAEVPIPYLDLAAQHRSIRSELLDGFARIVDTAGFIGGPHVAEFERDFAAFCACAGSVGVSNGTDALVVALRALGIGSGDRVIVPAFTFIATAEAVSLAGAEPVFVDVEPDTYTMCPQALERITALGGPGGPIKAVMPVHLYGQPADMDPIMAWASRHNLVVIEDAAQAHGASYGGTPTGSIGRIAGFSFYPGKNLGAIGDAGAVTSNDLDLLQTVRRFSDHGRKSKVEHSVIGQNARLDAIQAMALVIKLRHLADWNAGRSRVAGLYHDALNAKGDLGLDLRLPVIGPNRTHVHHVYAILTDERDALGDYLRCRGIQNGVHYAAPIHLQQAYAHLGGVSGSLAVAERLASRCLSLPIFPEMTEGQVARVAEAIADFAGGARA